MKKHLLLSIVLGAITIALKAQNSQAENLAQKIAQKMKDSLSLSDVQKSQIYAINMQLHHQKMEIRSQYTEHDVLRHYLQMVENKRDSLYRSVLPEAKYSVYKEKKRNLVSNN